ncbi:MAG TPA: hypothetical protein VNA21_13615 [Steroidobacteraceae bacterium]|nr:hypothetical protein [Steroidobacteraceae bacterium]
MDDIVRDVDRCTDESVHGETAALDQIAKHAAQQQRQQHELETRRNREFIRALTELAPGTIEKLRRLTPPLSNVAIRAQDFLKDTLTVRQLELVKTHGGPSGGGLKVKGAPFDFEWTAREDFGTPMADRTNGAMELGVSSISIPYDSDAETTWNGAGIGLRFTPKQGNPLVRIAPYLRFNYQWHNDSTLEVARNRGELGILVREGSNGPVLVDRRISLWNDGTSWYQTHSDAQDGVFSESTFFFAQPGRELSIWFWFNSSIDFNKMSGAFDFGGSSASNGLSAQLLFVVIEQ